MNPQGVETSAVALTYSFKVSVEAKELPITGATATSRVYDGTNQVAITGVALNGIVGAEDVSVNLEDVKGTISSANAETYDKVTLPELTLTGEDADNYTLVQPEAAVQTSVIIDKADATITVGTSSYNKTYGDADFTLDVKDNNLEADVTYSSSDENVATVSNGTVTIKGAGQATITVFLAASTNYNEAETTVTLTVNMAENAPDMPGSTISAPYTSKTVGAVSLPTGWEWKDDNKATLLEVGVSVTATAVYTGTDKGNYKKESVDITITRSSCNHSNKEVRNAVSATCAKEGYTGDTYCKDCGEKIESGNAIVKSTTHTWDAGKVTKEPTATEKGEKTYTCTICGETKDVELPATGSTTEEDDDEEDEEIPAKGTVLQDTVTKARYKVVSGEEDEPEVIYVGTTDKKATTIKIPETVEIDDIEYAVIAIADGAFKNNKKITKVEIADGVITIGKSTFYNCTSLKTVKIGNSVKVIGDKAFYGCKKLTSLTMGTNVTTIGNSAFQNCTALKKVTIPKKVTKIGKKAFYGCKKLTGITIKTTKLTTKKVGSKAFSKAGSSNYKKLTVKVPKSKLKSYKTMLRKRGLSFKAKVKK